MMSDPGRRSPPLLLGVAIFSALFILLGRGGFRKEVPPTFSPTQPHQLHVEFGPGFEVPGVYQFSDGTPLLSVIEMTIADGVTSTEISQNCPDSVLDGLLVRAVFDDKKVTKIQCGWMPASHRIALGVPLHPDRMTELDWSALPGVGEKMAKRIEVDRQINGDFGSLEALRRVKGVGVKRIKSWSAFF